MHPLVRNLYKRFVYVGRDYPVPPPYVKNRAKEAFRKNAALVDEVEIKRAVARGRWMVRELVGVIKLKKYRTMKQRYSASNLDVDPVGRADTVAREKFGS
mmetsp:Transcript_68366/g.154648  ORF Transcript_68366/g.154648 Transcript_68366/m.154648 type:complete len:100 (-) Transcript_68366:394-693(-)